MSTIMASSKLFWLIILLAIIHIVSANKSTESINNIEICPADCHCIKNETSGLTKLHCTSLNFIHKLTTKEIESVTTLNLSSSKLIVLDQRLKKLINLEKLNLAHNKLKDLKYFPHFGKLTHLNVRGNSIGSFSGKHLPSSLTHLDISHNQIVELPQDITRLNNLKHLEVTGNPFSCSRESLDTRDYLLEQHVHVTGKVLCQTPPKLKGQSWLHAIDFDEYFKLHPDEQVLGDQPEGSGHIEEASGDGLFTTETGDKKEQITTTEQYISTTDSDFDFMDTGSGDDVDEGKLAKIYVPVLESSTIIPNRVNFVSENPDKQSNLGTNIFLGVFLFCLGSLMIYAFKKNRDKSREQRRKRRQERLKQKPGIELMPKNFDQRKPSDKQNGNTESVSLMNGQNGKSSEPDAPTVRDVEEGFLPITNSQSLNSEPPLNDDKPPMYSDVKSVKVIASEIPGSVPQTPILVTRDRSSDGKSIVVTPKPNQRNFP